MRTKFYILIVVGATMLGFGIYPTLGGILIGCGTGLLVVAATRILKRRVR